jgi:1-phosphatidylinositol phosphodiesterase
MTDNKTAMLDKQNWMSRVLDIGKLKLSDIVWPCAHNAGMDKKAPNHEALVGHWTSCQNDTFAWQLANGARVFDIRLGFTDSPAPTFYFHHNGFRSGRVLDDLIDALLPFLDRNPDEFVVLDFHQLGDDDHFFDHKRFSDLLVRRLGLRIIPAADQFNTVEELKRSSAYRRIVMAAPFNAQLDRDYFWPAILHQWHGKTFTSTTELQQHIEKTLERVPRETFLWSLSATCYSLFGGPQDIKHRINEWFHTTADWVTRCSIISTDFFDESEIVRYCWSASSMKAVYGHGLRERAGTP